MWLHNTFGYQPQCHAVYGRLTPLMTVAVADYTANNMWLLWGVSASDSYLYKGWFMHEPIVFGQLYIQSAIKLRNWHLIINKLVFIGFARSKCDFFKNFLKQIFKLWQWELFGLNKPMQ